MLLTGDKLFYQLYYKAVKVIASTIPTIRDSKENVIATTCDEKCNVLSKHFNEPLTQNKYETKHEEFHITIDQFVGNYHRNGNQKGT